MLLQLFAQDDISADRLTPKYSDEYVDEIIARRYARWQKQQEKAIDEARKSERMEAQQRLECERKKYLEKLKEYRRKDILDDMVNIYRKVFEEDIFNQEEKL